jgi:glycosyltransferase involved in cell wall biosynthesis
MLRVGFVFNNEMIVGDGEFSFMDLADAIRTHGVEPVCIVPGEGEVSQRLRAAGFPVEVIPWPPIRLLGLRQMLRHIQHVAAAFSSMGLHMIHVNGAHAMLYCGPAARRVNIPCVWHIRAIKRDLILDWVRSYFSDAIITNSSTVRHSLKCFACDRSKVHVIYNGVRLETLAKAPAADLAGEFDLSTPILLAAGWFSPWKRFEDVISAVDSLHAEGVKCSLLLAGRSMPDDADYEASLRELARGKAFIRFAGWREDVASLLQSASAMVLSSQDEPFGRILIEAWACGTPVIATEGGGPAEFIHSGENGLLYNVGVITDLKTKIRRIIDDPYLAAALAAAGRRSAQAFTLERHASEVHALYAQLLAGRSPVASGT